jgi:type II secretory pathway pseudopilin PulG
MKLNTNNTRKAGAFTLIEMIGVLAVIAILAALLIPKVFSAINDARINNACISTDTIKTAVADHYGKYGKLATIAGTNDLTVPTTGTTTAYDQKVLMVEGLLDKPYTVKIAGTVAGGDPSTNAAIQLVLGTASNNSQGYLLDGNNNATLNASVQVVEAVIHGVSAQDAKDLNDRIDGPSLGAALSAADTKGRVEYAAGSPTDVHIYITHR